MSARAKGAARRSLKPRNADSTPHSRAKRTVARAPAALTKSPRPAQTLNENRSAEKVLRPRFRILCGSDIAIGPGKAELLEKVQEVGSIAEAAKQMGMSYMRAWTLIQTMQRCFKEPLIMVARGGSRGGGAELTGTGRKVLELYHRMETQSLQANQSAWEQMRELLRD